MNCVDRSCINCSFTLTYVPTFVSVVVSHASIVVSHELYGPQLYLQ